MSDFLTIGGTRVPIAAPSGADEEYQEYGGEVVRSFSGRLLSTVRGCARVWRLQTPPLPDSEAQMLAAVLAHGSPLTCSGALIGSDPVSCYARGVRTRPVAPLSRLRRVVEFELHEAAPIASPILFRLHAGQPIPPGASFTRASSATYIDRDGIIRQAAPNVPRIEWYDLDGDGVRETPTLLLEPAATNLIPDSYGITGWGGGATATANAGTAPDGTNTATRISGIDDAAGERWNSVLLSGQSIAGRTFSGGIWLRGEGADIGRQVGISIARSVGTFTGASQAVTLTDAWQRVRVGPMTGLPDNVGLKFTINNPGTNPADSCLIWGAQVEESAVLTSTIPTPTQTTRSADVLTFPWPHAPQAMTIYLRFIEVGATIPSGAARVLLDIGAAASPTRIWIGQGSTASRYSVAIDGATGSASTVLSAGPAIGDRVALLGRLYGNGSVQIEQAINGGTPTVAARSAAVGLTAAWSNQVLSLSARPGGGNPAPAAWRDAVVLRGASWTLDDVRRLVR